MIDRNKPHLSKKDRKKRIRSIFQALALLVLAYWLLVTLLTTTSYTPYEPLPAEAPDHGFIAVSYFGVDRNGTNSLVSTKRLEQHISALRNSGYVTITQQDVLDYYNSRKPLPEKALLLMFEDGRRDTSIFSQKIMEQYNTIATMFSYADKFEKDDPKFLSPADMKNMEKSTFWELGTNGYRLEFINVFDRYNYYLGELTSLQFSMVAPYLNRKYDHYLMDYIRDEYGIPKETHEQMKTRINQDYELMEQVYLKELGKLPSFYALMHSNTGQFGTNEKASAVNGENIYRLFAMNINREGFSHNDKHSSIYDLTRMQPQPSWSVNHLLMRIWDDTGQDMAFVTGDEEQAASWTTLEGKAEFGKGSIILTSLPKGAGSLRLNDSDLYGNIALTVQLDGNALGSQAVFVRADEALRNYIGVAVKDKNLVVTQVRNGQPQELFSQRLDVLTGIPPVSIPEDQKQTEIGRLKMRLKYSDGAQNALNTAQHLAEVEQRVTPPVSEEVEEFIPSLDLNELQSKQLSISIKENLLSVTVDGFPAVSDLAVQCDPVGSVVLEARSSIQKYNQRNLTDDVYDGVFRDIAITDPAGASLFDGRPDKLHRTLFAIQDKWDALINWFIDTL